MEEEKTKEDILRNPTRFATSLTKSQLEKLLVEEMEKSPDRALEYVPNYIEHIPEEKRGELLTRVVRESSASAVRHLPRYIEHIPEEQRAGLLTEAMEKNPDVVLGQAHHYIEHIPEDQRVGLLTGAMEKSPGGALNYADTYIEHIPQYQRAGLLTEAIEQESPDIALETASNYIEHIPEEQRAELLIELMGQDPRFALRNASRNIEHIPEDQRAELLIELMGQSPGGALYYTSDYIECIPEDQRAALLTEAMEQSPELALKNADRYIEHIPEELRVGLLVEAMKQAPYADELMFYTKNYIEYIPEEQRVGLLIEAQRDKKGLLYHIDHLPEELRVEYIAEASHQRDIFLAESLEAKERIDTNKVNEVLVKGQPAVDEKPNTALNKETDFVASDKASEPSGRVIEGDDTDNTLYSTLANDAFMGKQGEDSFVFVNEYDDSGGYNDVDGQGHDTITDFQTSIFWGFDEDKIIVDEYVGGARIYTNNNDAVIVFEDVMGNVIPGRSITLEDFEDGIVFNRLDDIDILLGSEEGEALSSDKIKIIEGTPDPIEGLSITDLTEESPLTDSFMVSAHPDLAKVDMDSPEPIFDPKVVSTPDFMKV